MARMVVRVRGPVKHRLRKLRRKTPDKGLAARCQIVLLWSEGEPWIEIARAVGCSLSWVGRVIRRFGDHGVAGLYDRREDNGQSKLDESYLATLYEIVDRQPDDFGYPRPTWTQELLANILRNANAGKQKRTVDAETTPLRHPENYMYDLNLADITEVWRRGSVIASWLLDLTALSLLDSPDLAKFAGRVSDSGEGRWTIAAGIDEAVPAPVLSAALYARFSSRGADDFADKVLSALRYQFGGHKEKSTTPKGGFQ
jgi:transposase